MMWEEKIFYERCEARNEGREDERVRFVKRALVKKMPIEEMADLLELDVAEVQTLVDNITSGNS